MNCKRCVIMSLLIIPCLGKTLLAQSIIEGTVSNREKEPIDGCVVFLLDASTLLLSDDALTDPQGNYAVTAPGPGVYIIEFRNLSYRDTAFRLTIDQQPRWRQDAVLEARIFDLQAVEVVDKLLGIRRSGDTLFYNIHAYTDGSESVFSDVLRKLPGVDVSSAGQVSYMGKTVDALLVDGNNLTGSRHYDITQNFQAEDIERVQIIENYLDEFEGRQQAGEVPKVAMNIELKKDKKGTTTGNMEAGYGYDQRYTFRGNALHSEPRQGFAVFAGSSNYETDPQIENPVRLYPEASFDFLGLNNFSYTDYALFIPPELKGKVSDHFLRLTESNRSNDIWTRRTFFHAAGRSSQSELLNSTYRFADQSTEEQRLTQEFDQLNIQLDHDSKIDLSQSWKFFLKAKGHWFAPDFNTVDTGYINMAPYGQLAKAKRHFGNMELSARSEWSPNPTQTVKVLADYHYLNAQSDWNIQSDSTWQDFTPEDSMYEGSVKYHDRYDQHLLTVGGEYQWSPGAARFSLYVSHNRLQEQLKVDFLDTLYTGVNKNALLTTEIGVKTYVEWNTFKITGNLSLVGTSDRYGQSEKVSRILPSLVISHDVGHLSVLSAQVKRMESAPGIFYLHELPLLFDQKTIAMYGLMADEHVTSWYASLSYKIKPGTHKNVFIATLSATWPDQTLVATENFEGNHILRSGQYIPSDGTYRLMAFGWHSEDNWKLNFNHFSTYNAGYTILDGQTASLDNFWSRTVIGLSYKGFKRLEINLAPEIQYQVQDVTDIHSTWINPILGLSAMYKNDTWEWSLGASRNLSKTDDLDLKVQVINFSIGYRGWTPFRLYLEGNDILNISSNQSLSATINPTYSKSILASRIPGNIVLIGRYDF